MTTPTTPEQTTAILDDAPPLAPTKPKAPRKRASRAKPKDITATPSTADIKALSDHWLQQFPDLSDMHVLSEDDWNTAGIAEAQIIDTLKEMESKRLEIARPINDGLKRLKAEVDETKRPLEALRDHIHGLRAGWKRDEDTRLAALQLAADQAREAEKAQLAQEHNLTPERVEEYLPPPPPVATTPTSVATPDGGTLTTRRVPKWRYTSDPVPYSHQGEVLYKVDEAAITRLRQRAGDDLTSAPAGIEYYYDDVPVRR